MDLDDAHLAAVLVHVLAERDQPRLTRLDEPGQLGYPCCAAPNMQSLSRLVAMKMNGPDMNPPLVWICSWLLQVLWCVSCR